MTSMTACSATLSTHQRHVLQTLLTRESQIVQQCNQHTTRFTEILNELQCIRHASESNEVALKCDDFIRSCAQLDCDTFNHDPVPGTAVQTAMNCDCMCMQAACFRVLYKWTPHLDRLRMKLLKIKNMCARPRANEGVNTCARIEKTVHKILNLKTASHHSHLSQ
jgi:hypothetical protein